MNRRQNDPAPKLEWEMHGAEHHATIAEQGICIARNTMTNKFHLFVNNKIVVDDHDNVVAHTSLVNAKAACQRIANLIYQQVS